MSNPLENAQRIEYSESATDGDLAVFQNDQQREMDLQEFMQGQNHQEGGRHDLDPRGLSSQNFNESYDHLIDGGNGNNQLEAENTYRPSPSGQDFRKLYGQSENEKGELRRALQAQLDMHQQLMAEVAALKGSYGQAQQQPPPQFWNNGQQQGQQFQYQQQPVAQQQVQLPKFINKSDDEMLLPSDVNRVLTEQVAPYVFAVQAQAQQAQQAALQAQQQLFETQKLNIGLTQQLEMQILQRKPWLRSINDPSAYLSSMAGELAEIKRSTPSMSNGNGGGVQYAPQSPQPQQRILRRVSYVEGGGGTSNAQDRQNVNPQEALQAAWQETLNMEFGKPERAKRQREILRKLGIDEVTGYRDQNILTR